MSSPPDHKLSPEALKGLKDLAAREAEAPREEPAMIEERARLIDHELDLTWRVARDVLRSEGSDLALDVLKNAFAQAGDDLGGRWTPSPPVAPEYSTFQEVLGRLGPFSWAFHNILAHPLAEILFLVGAQRWSYRLHDATLPAPRREQ